MNEAIGVLVFLAVLVGILIIIAGAVLGFLIAYKFLEKKGLI